MLCCNFRAVSKPECNCATLSHCGDVDDCQPQLFVKLGDDKRTTFDVLNEDFYGFCFTEPFSLDGIKRKVAMLVVVVLANWIDAGVFGTSTCRSMVIFAYLGNEA